MASPSSPGFGAHPIVERTLDGGYVIKWIGAVAGGPAGSDIRTPLDQLARGIELANVALGLSESDRNAVNAVAKGQFQAAAKSLAALTI